MYNAGLQYQASAIEVEKRMKDLVHIYIYCGDAHRNELNLFIFL
jgi:hypothetical protein